MTVPARNAFAELARQRKTQLLVASIDAALGMWGVDPFSVQALEIVLSMNAAAWAQALRNAKLESASEHTRHLVEDCYRRRVEVRACLARIA